jgi:hypothetical protein
LASSPPRAAPEGIEAADIFAPTAVDSEVAAPGAALGGEEANLEALGAAAAAEAIRGKAAKRLALRKETSDEREEDA